MFLFECARIVLLGRCRAVGVPVPFGSAGKTEEVVLLAQRLV